MEKNVEELLEKCKELGEINEKISNRCEELTREVIKLQTLLEDVANATLSQRVFDWGRVKQLILQEINSDNYI